MRLRPGALRGREARRAGRPGHELSAAVPEALSRFSGRAQSPGRARPTRRDSRRGGDGRGAVCTSIRLQLRHGRAGGGAGGALLRPGRKDGHRGAAEGPSRACCWTGDLGDSGLWARARHGEHSRSGRYRRARSSRVGASLCRWPAAGTSAPAQLPDRLLDAGSARLLHDSPDGARGRQAGEEGGALGVGGGPFPGAGRDSGGLPHGRRCLHDALPLSRPHPGRGWSTRRFATRGTRM